MPELPEVELFRRYFERHAIGRVIEKLEVRDARVLTTPERNLRRALAGRELIATRRHGKHLFVETDAPSWFRLHFGMSGDLISFRPSDEEPRFARVIFRFTDGTRLAFDDMRLFGKVGLIDSPESFIEQKSLGRDPLDARLTITRFRNELTAHRGGIKAALMSQEIVAGLGNLYVDELLYQTAIHPTRTIDNLSNEDVRHLFTKMRHILEKAIDLHELGRDYPRSYLIRHRDEAERCPKCGGELMRATIAGRTTYWCKAHQT